MSPTTNGRFRAPEPPVSVVACDIAEGKTLDEYRRERVLLIDKRGKRRWRWQLAR